MPRSIFRRTLALALLAALAAVPSACRPQNEGTVKVLVIGPEPRLRDPAAGPLAPGDAVLIQNVAQGLVRFDASAQIVPGLAERWNVSDDGLSYIFRIAATDWPTGGKVTARQVARILKRSIAASSTNPLKDTLGAVQDIVPMTDRVIEIRLSAPRPNLLTLLAQPEFGIVRGGTGAGPFRLAPERGPGGELRLTREVLSGEGEQNRRDEVLLAGADAGQAVAAFGAAKSDLVLGGTFADLPFAQRVKLPRNALRFDPASGLFGLVPGRADGPIADAGLRRLLSQAIDRDALVNALRVPGLATRATVLEPGLEGTAAPPVPPWLAEPIDQRRQRLAAAARGMFGANLKPTLRVWLSPGPGADILLNRLTADWGAIGVTLERSRNPAGADLRLIDLVAPSASAAWFLRQFRCQAVPLCDPDADQLLDAARQTLVPAQRYALLSQAAARIDEAQLFLPLAAPVRWSLVSGRIQGFAGNRYARHTLTDLEQKPAGG
jgi:peptide/nickel transport system substrate-binding protein